MPPKPNEERREELLDELEAIILAEGFEHLRVGALAKRLRCSRSTLYKLALSKEKLVTLIFTRSADRAIEEAAASAATLSDPTEKIMRYSEVITAYQNRGSEQFWRDVLAHPAVGEALSERRAMGYRYVVSYIQEGIDSGVFRPVNTAWMGHLIWLCARAAREPDLEGRFGLDRAEANRELANLIIYGLRKEPGC